jgi:exopolyphosphatase/guanosine-5'-triphosphate,3'-diphosphate pyrophosphatase
VSWGAKSLSTNNPSTPSSPIDASMRPASSVPYTGAVPGWRTSPRVTVQSNRVRPVSAATVASTASARSSSEVSTAMTGCRALSAGRDYDPPRVRVGVVDIGTNSTRLLIADVEDGRVHEVERRSQVTRLGEGVDATGRLGEEPMRRVFDTLQAYHEAIVERGCDATTGVLTSAVRDAANGAEFTAAVRARFDLDVRTVDGDEEARLTFLGATAGREAPAGGPLLVLDIGGGSTEFVVGAQGDVAFHVSTQAGVVRQTERHVHTDPPAAAELQALVAEVRGIIADSVPPEVRDGVAAGVAVAGTATSAAAIEQELDPYDPNRVEGYVLELGDCELLLARLAAMPLAERRTVVGLHPDRAPTIVAGVAILLEALRAFDLDRVEVSERDILWGCAIACIRQVD